jgi:hypothetical protein
MRPIFFGKAEQGKLVLDRPDRFKEYLLTLEKKEIEVIVGIIKKPRSKKENRYYWGVVINLLSETTGYNEDEMHDALKMLFLKDETREIPTLRSTTLLTTVEFEEYLSKIRTWASQILHCYIPEPNEVEV